MSGGHFDYDQFKIRQIADEVEQIIFKNGEKREKRESWEDEYYYNNHLGLSRNSRRV